MNGRRSMHDQKLLIRRLLGAGPFVRSGSHWRFGARIVKTCTIERLIREGRAFRDGDVVRAKESA